jgi:hypothetical protein
MEAGYLLSQETSWTWRQIYNTTQVNTRSAALAPRLLGQCSLGNRGFFPTPTSSTCCGPLCYLLAWPCYRSLTLPSPLLISHVAQSPSFPLFLYNWVFSNGGSVWCLLLTLVLRSRIFLRFLRNVGSYKIYTAPHPRRRHSSQFTKRSYQHT